MTRNSVKKVLTEDISLEEQSSLAETQKSLRINDELNTESVLEDSLLRVFVSQQDKYSPVSRKEIELNTFLFPPVEGQVSQPFDRNKSHYAVDIAVEKNMPIKAIADGTVVFSEWTSETGYVIILEHNFGLLLALYWWFWYLSRIFFFYQFCYIISYPLTSEEARDIIF